MKAGTLLWPSVHALLHISLYFPPFAHATDGGSRQKLSTVRSLPGERNSTINRERPLQRAIESSADEWMGHINRFNENTLRTRLLLHRLEKRVEKVGAKKRPAVAYQAPGLTDLPVPLSLPRRIFNTVGNFLGFGSGDSATTVEATSTTTMMTTTANASLVDDSGQPANSLGQSGQFQQAQPGNSIGQSGQSQGQTGQSVGQPSIQTGQSVNQPVGQPTGQVGQSVGQPAPVQPAAPQPAGQVAIQPVVQTGLHVEVDFAGGVLGGEAGPSGPAGSFGNALPPLSAFEGQYPVPAFQGQAPTFAVRGPPPVAYLSCFPPDALVRVLATQAIASRRRMKRMDELVVGDWVLAAKIPHEFDVVAEGREADVELVPSRVTGWLHREPDTLGAFHRVRLESGRTLEATGTHLVHVDRHCATLADHNSSALPPLAGARLRLPPTTTVERLSSDDCLYTTLHSEENEEVEWALPERIASIERPAGDGWGRGIYAPLTEHGSIVVGEVLASCFMESVEERATTPPDIVLIQQTFAENARRVAEWWAATRGWIFGVDRYAIAAENGMVAPPAGHFASALLFSLSEFVLPS